MTLKKTVMSSSIFSRASSNITSSIKSPKITFGGVAKAIGSQPDIPELDKLKPSESSPLAGMISELQSKYESLSGRVQDNSRKITSIKNILQNERSTIGDNIPGDNNVEDSLNEVNNTLQEIGNALALDFANRIQEKEDNIAKLKRSVLRRRKREKEESIEGSDKIDKDNSFLNKAFDKVTKPAIGLFGGIIEFFTTLGAAILAKGAFDWLQNPENMEKVKGVFKWLGDNWTWIAGALALGAVVVVIGQIAGIIMALGVAFTALKAALILLSPLAWPIIAVAAIASISGQGLGTHESATARQLQEMGGNTVENRRRLIARLEASKANASASGEIAEIDEQIHLLRTGRQWGIENAPSNVFVGMNEYFTNRPLHNEIVSMEEQIRAHYDPLIAEHGLLSLERFRLGAEAREEMAQATKFLRTTWNYLEGKPGISWKVENGEFIPEYTWEQIQNEEPGSLYTPYSDGGVVFGPEGIDKVPTNLTAGEFVTNAESTKKFLPALFAQNNNAGELWASLENGIRKQTENNEKQTDINAKFNEILVGFNQQLANLALPEQTGGGGPTAVSSRPPVTPQIGGSSVSTVPKQVGMLQKSSSVSVVHLDMPDQTMNIDARTKESGVPQTIDVLPSAVTLGDTIVPSPMDSYNMRRLDESLAVYGIRG